MAMCFCRRSFSFNRISLLFVICLLALLTACGSGNGSSTPKSPAPTPPLPLTKLSTDTFTNTSGQHATEVEPDAFAFGSTIVAAFQAGRRADSLGGSSDIGFATSSDGGATWQNGFLPDITIFEGVGSNTSVSDPTVAYNAKFGKWLIASLPIAASGIATVAVSSSSDGLNWSGPVQVSHTADADKDWIVCDNNPISSPNYGNCYMEWDDSSAKDLIWMSVSADGGQTWQTAQNTADAALGLGGVPLVQPNGNVVVPIMQICTTTSCTPNMLGFTSVNGGASWSSTTKISAITDHQAAGNLRSDPLPASAMDANGNVYVVWQDCRFRVNCSTNDLIMSTSADGVTWTIPARIPIDGTSSGADHFIPGLGIDSATAGATAHLGLTYYFYPTAACGASPACQLEAGFISSQNGGQTWTAPTTLTIPMSLTWLPNTFAGVMVGDYIATVYANGKARPIFALANAPSGALAFDESIYTTASALASVSNARQFSSAADHPVPRAHSDHGPRQFYDLEHRRPIEPPR
jgi:hypothetical protein